MSLQEVAEKTLELEAAKVIIIDGWKGRFGRIKFFNIGEKGLIQIPPEIQMRKIKLQREFEGGERKPLHPLFIDENKQKNREIERLKESLSMFLEVPIMSIDKALGRYRSAIRLQLDPSNLIMISFYALPSIVEIGPRITVSHAVWEI